MLVELWGFQNEDRGTVVGRYVKAQKEWLREEGYLSEWIISG